MQSQRGVNNFITHAVAAPQKRTRTVLYHFFNPSAFAHILDNVGGFGMGWGKM
jgi:hypothetical protein